MSQGVQKPGSAFTTDVKTLDNARTSGTPQEARDAQQRVDTRLDAIADAVSKDVHLSREQKLKLEGQVADFRRIVDDPKTSSTALDTAMLNFIDDLRRR